jgi:nonsense-mediated mRNA decay protein 3
MFCVECGRDGEVFEALCAQCFLDRKKLVELPEVLDVTLCSSCANTLVGKKWAKEELDAVIDQLISSSTWLNPALAVLGRDSDKRFEDQNNMSVLVKTSIRLGDQDRIVERGVRIRLKHGTCPVCSKRHGSYYEAIIQVRTGSGKLSLEKKSEIMEHVYSRVKGPGPDGTSFISKVEEMHGGLDFYMGSNRDAKSVAKELAKRYGAKMNSSPRLHGKVKGKEVYRVTYLVRLP